MIYFSTYDFISICRLLCNDLQLARYIYYLYPFFAEFFSLLDTYLIFATSALDLFFQTSTYSLTTMPICMMSA